MLLPAGITDEIELRFHLTHDNFSLVQCKLPDDGRRPRHLRAISINSNQLMYISVFIKTH